MTPKTIYLIDGFDDGHHLTHLRNYALTLLNMGHRVVELLPDPSKVQDWLGDRGPDVSFFQFKHEHVVSPSWRLRNIYEPLMAWLRAGRAVRRAEQATGNRADLVFFCWLDDYIVGGSPLLRRLIPAVFPYRWSGVFFHPWHLRISGGERRSESVGAEDVLKAKRCAGVAVLDHGIAGQLAANTGKPVIPLPDETEEALPESDPPLVEEIHRRAGDRRVVGLLGHLSRRKGVMSLLDVAEAARDRDWFFVFAGELGDAQMQTFDEAGRERVKRAIEGSLPNVFFHPERIDDERDFNAVVAACDVLYAAYDLFAHSSGIVTKAGIFEKPIIVSPGYYMEEVVDEFRLGQAVNPNDTPAVIQSIETALDQKAWHAAVGKPDYDSFRKRHSVLALEPAFSRLGERVH